MILVKLDPVTFEKKWRVRSFSLSINMLEWFGEFVAVDMVIGIVLNPNGTIKLGVDDGYRDAIQGIWDGAQEESEEEGFKDWEDPEDGPQCPW